MNSNVPILYSQNTENQLFDLYYAFDMGTNNDKLLPIAIDYIPYLGTSKMKPAEVQQEFYKLGCSFNVFNSENQTWVSLTGLSENFDKATLLFESLFTDPKIDAETLKMAGHGQAIACFRPLRCSGGGRCSPRATALPQRRGRSPGQTSPSHPPATLRCAQS